MLNGSRRYLVLMCLMLICIRAPQLSRLRLTLRHTICPRGLSAPMSTSTPTSTFSLPQGDSEVSVHLTAGLLQEQLLSFPAFKTWLSTLQHSLATQNQKSHAFHEAPYQLRRIDIQHVDFFGEGRIGFLKLKAVVSNGKGEKLPGSVFLRGGSVAMMVGQPFFVSRKMKSLSHKLTSPFHLSLFYNQTT